MIVLNFWKDAWGYGLDIAIRTLSLDVYHVDPHGRAPLFSWLKP